MIAVKYKNFYDNVIKFCDICNELYNAIASELSIYDNGIELRNNYETTNALYSDHKDGYMVEYIRHFSIDNYSEYESTDLIPIIEDAITRFSESNKFTSVYGDKITMIIKDPYYLKNMYRYESNKDSKYKNISIDINIGIEHGKITGISIKVFHTDLRFYKD